MTRRLLGGLLGVGAAGVAAAAYATFVEPRRFVLRHVTAPVLRPGAQGSLRILHLSDLHLPSRHRQMSAFLTDCIAQRPDLVVVTGDILGGPSTVDPALDLLTGLAPSPDAPLALYVLGSNDFYGPTPKNPLRYLQRNRTIRPEGARLDTARLVEGLDAAGWQQVDNRRVRIDTVAGPVEVYGQGDAHLGLDAPDEVDWSPVADDAVLALGVAHAPYRRVLDRMDRAGCDLALAGHTHGGQLRVPGFGALVANCDLPLRQARGLSGYGAGLALHVSAGLGGSPYTPFRFACRPEATLIEAVDRSSL